VTVWQEGAAFIFRLRLAGGVESKYSSAKQHDVTFYNPASRTAIRFRSMELVVVYSPKPCCRMRIAVDTDGDGNVLPDAVF
jgi:hypothetical protein